MNPIKFEKATLQQKDIIFEWLEEQHMQEFWDNSQAHKDDIMIFMHGRKQPSTYFNGIFTYWIGSYDGEPYCFLLTAKVVDNDNLPVIWRKYLSQSGTTYSIDFGIGNLKFLGKGYAAPTLQAFTTYFQSEIDSSVDAFYIDPDVNNQRAIHVYAKAGFQIVGEFIPDGGAFKGKKSYLMIFRAVN